jgi:acyl carrier protein
VLNFDFKDLTLCIGTALNVEVEKIERKSLRSNLEEWDSFGQIAIAVSIENRFNIQLTKEELFSFNSIEDLIKILEKNSIKIA